MLPHGPNALGTTVVSPCRSRTLSLALVVALSGALIHCGEKKPPPPKDLVRPVKIVELHLGKAGAVIELPGVVQAAQTAKLAFEVAGRIIELPVKEGQRLKKGAIIAKLDARDYVARLASANARLREAKANFDRATELYESDSIAAAELDQRRAELGVARASYSEMAKARQETVLRAPFDGEVAQELVKKFANVRAKETVVVFVDASSFEVEIDVPEQHLAGGRTGRSLDEVSAEIKPQVVVSTIPDKKFPARLKEFAKVADAVTRTFKVTLAFERPKGLTIMPGMTAKVLVTPPADARGGTVRLPVRAAVTDEAGNVFVWLVDPKSMQVRRAKVKLGPLSGSSVSIETGLEGSEWVATTGMHKLREGMKVSRYLGDDARGGAR